MENGEDRNDSQVPAEADDERPSFKTREQVYDRIGTQPDPVGEAPGQGVEAPERGAANGADALDAERETEAAVDLQKHGAKRPTADTDGDGKAKPVYPRPRPSSKVCILSIDGGGVRGVIPSKILTRLEQMLAEKSGDPDARVADYFDLVAGTSAGGILAVTLLAPNEAGRPMFSAAEAGTFFTRHAGTIFPRNKHTVKVWRLVKNVFRPAYRARPLEKLLASYLTTPAGKTLTLKDILRPVLITTYDILHARPLFFFCQRARLSPSHDYLLTDVCRATSAAPALFPPARISSVDQKNRRVCVDGGVIANNPALAAVHHVMANTEDFPTDGPARRSCRDMLVLSIGAGQDETTLEYEQTRKWGMAKWAGALLDVMVFGNANMTHYQLCIAFDSEGARDNYLRIETTRLPKQSKVLDNTHPRNLARLSALADECLTERARYYDPEVGHLVPMGQTNEERLDRFADQLVAERRARLQQQPHRSGLSDGATNVDEARAFEQ
ncbi:hypothetical protein KFL_001980070 [Klebsormidium nitens]|uniref:Patatin n=1 Tax=Klebsormidium nitens TaxID=105231 RepID=A0A1Y1I137_KLENI|nr:hypothetical protein KFL_001980070 [Klebsormidium nitens]|eukprot:GAQ84625.1 hypothetical protein KFL_001980070 [Klebsormidium nitens]